MTHALAETLHEVRGRVMAESATGIRQATSHLGRLYTKGGFGIAPIEAQSRIRDGEAIEYPNAGAGSYYEVFKQLGFNQVEMMDSMSSAGDWTFAVQDREGWRMAWQTNRYPYHGFAYSVDKRTWETLEIATDYYNAGL